VSSKRVVDLADFSKELGNFARASLDAKRKAVSAGLARSIPDLVAASPVDTGLYAASWQFTVGERSAIIGNTAPYAGVIEYGARPFKPPIGPLLAWAKRVLTGTKDDQGHIVQTGQPETGYSSEVWALAVHTQKKIMDNGMAPRHVLENMIPKIIENIRLEMQRSVS
jgi:hypothetical protein